MNKKKPKFSVNNVSNSKRIAIQKKVNAEVLELDEDFADDEDHTPKNKQTAENDGEDKDKVDDLKNDTVHKKRRRKNVESRDAFTQTDRSDYMLIKQRQQEKQKQLKQMLALKSGEHVNEADARE